MFSVLSTFFSENFEPEWALRLENRDKSQGYRIVFGFQDIFSGAEKTALEKNCNFSRGAQAASPTGSVGSMVSSSSGTMV